MKNLESVKNICESGIKEIESGIDLKTEEGRTVFGNLLITVGLVSQIMETETNLACKQIHIEKIRAIFPILEKFSNLVNGLFQKFQTEGI